MVRLLLFLLFILVIEFYSFQVVKTLTNIRWILIGYQLVSLSIIVFIAYQFFTHDRSVGQTKTTMLTLGLLLVTFLPKILLTVVLLLEDIYRLSSGTISYITENKNDSFLPERRKFVSQIALGLAAIPFSSLLYGITFGKYNYKVIKQTLFFPDLPDAFDGFKITQISDIHSGSFDNSDQINHAIDLINEQNSDLILFTGDIVNTHATEMYPWIETFNRIKKPEFGKFSVLGNHDYGEYIDWPSKEEKDKNFSAIKDLHRQIDFKLLLNENVKIKKNNAEIAIVGVENWGLRFKKAGDLHKASEGLSKEEFKILMSHDRSFY